MKKTNKIILATLLASSLLAGGVFAQDVSTNTMETNISVVKNDFKVFKKQIQQLREQLKNTQTKEEKLAIHQKMLELIQTYETKYPILFGRYIHTDFHVTEQELKEELKKEIEKLRENLQAQLSGVRAERIESWEKNMKGLRKGLSKDVKEKMKDIWKNYKEQIEELKESLKGKKTFEERQEILQKIRNLRIERLEQIKNLLPADKQTKVEAYLNNLKEHFAKVDNIRNTFKSEKESVKQSMYNNLTDKVKSVIDKAIEKFKEKLSKLPADRQLKVYNRVLEKINKIIFNHLNSNQKKDTIHFKTEISILNYLKEKVEQLKDELNLKTSLTDETNLINNIINK